MLIGLSVCNNILLVDEVFLSSISLHNRSFGEGSFEYSLCLLDCSNGLVVFSIAVSREKEDRFAALVFEGVT